MIAAQVRKDLFSKATLFWATEWLATLAFLTAGLAGQKISRAVDLWDRVFGDDDSRFKVGTLYRQEGSVRRKRDATYLWRDVVGVQQPVSNGDAVFTGPDGRAKIVFENQSSLELGP